MLDAAEELFEQCYVKYRLSDGVVGAGFHLALEAADLFVDINHAGIGPHTDGESRVGPEGVAADNQRKIQSVHNVDQPDGVDIEHGGRIGIVAHLWGITGDANQVVNAHGIADQQLRLHAEHVAVAAREMQRRLDFSLLLDERAQGEVAQARRRTRAVRDVDGVDACRLEVLGSFNLFAEVDPFRRHDLYQRHKLAGGELATQVRALRQKGRDDARFAFALGHHVKIAGPAPDIAYSHAGLHGFGVLRRGSAASAHQADARVYEFARVAGHIFRRTQIDVATFNVARDAGVGVRRQRQLGDATNAFDGAQHGYRSDAAVATDHVSAPLFQFGGECFRAGAVQTVAVFVDGHLRNDLRIGRGLARGQNCLVQLFEIPERLQDQKIDAAFHQTRNPLTKRCPGFFTACLTQGLNAHAQWPDRACDQGCGCLLQIEGIDCFARQTHSVTMDLMYLFAH